MGTLEERMHGPGISVENQSVSESIVGPGGCCDTGFRLLAYVVECAPRSVSR